MGTASEFLTGIRLGCPRYRRSYPLTPGFPHENPYLRLTGLIGSALTRAASAAGTPIVPLSRKRGMPRPFTGIPKAGTIDSAALEGSDAVVHLAGESIAARRWTAAQKARILNSRVKGTQLLASALQK